MLTDIPPSDVHVQGNAVMCSRLMRAYIRGYTDIGQRLYLSTWLNYAGRFKAFAISDTVAFSASLTLTPPKPIKPPSSAASATCSLI